MKKQYKELKKKLKNEFIKPNHGQNFDAYGGVGLWCLQCGVKPSQIHTTIICKIIGRVPFLYQESDRKVILKYLKKNKYKEFKEC